MWGLKERELSVNGASGGRRWPWVNQGGVTKMRFVFSCPKGAGKECERKTRSSGNKPWKEGGFEIKWRISVSVARMTLWLQQGCSKWSLVLWTQLIQIWAGAHGRGTELIQQLCWLFHLEFFDPFSFSPLVFRMGISALFKTFSITSLKPKPGMNYWEGGFVELLF